MLSSAANALGALVTSPCLGGLRHFSATTAAAVGHKVGFIGLGKMGSRMVNHLLENGTNVVAYDHNRLALSHARDVAKQHPQGTLQCRDCPADLSNDPEIPVVITMLSSAADAKQCYLGAKGLFKGATGGPTTSLFIDCTTVDPATTRQLAASAGMLHLSPNAPVMPNMNLNDGKPHLIDAPVTGAVTGAEAGTLTFMVGGNKAAAAAASKLLMEMGKHVIYCGDHGSGLLAKMCNNLVLSASMAAVAESLALGNRLGLDPKVLTEVLNHGAARCWSSESYNPVPRVLGDPMLPSNRGYRPGLPASSVSQHLTMLLEAAQTAQSPVPVARAVLELYGKIEHEGLGDKDFSSIYRYVYGSGCSNSEWKEGDQLFSAHTP